MKATSKGRARIVWALLALALVGGAMRQLAPNPSFTRDLGNLLLVLWVPVIGNVVGWVIQKLRIGPRPPPDFEAGSAFMPHAQVELVPLDAALLARAGPVPIAAEENRCALVVGKDAITVRLPVRLAEWLEGRVARSMPVQFLRPDLALPRFAPGTAFRVLVGTSIVGEGRVLQALAPASDAAPAAGSTQSVP